MRRIVEQAVYVQINKVTMDAFRGKYETTSTEIRSVKERVQLKIWFDPLGDDWSEPDT